VEKMTMLSTKINKICSAFFMHLLRTKWKRFDWTCARWKAIIWKVIITKYDDSGDGGWTGKVGCLNLLNELRGLCMWMDKCVSYLQMFVCPFKVFVALRELCYWCLDIGKSLTTVHHSRFHVLGIIYAFIIIIMRRNCILSFFCCHHHTKLDNNNIEQTPTTISQLQTYPNFSIYTLWFNWFKGIHGYSF